MRGLPPLGRLVGLALICAGLGTVSLARPELAEAVAKRASADSPTAVAISSDGVAYVGFSGGDKIQRLAAGNGKPKGTIELQDDSAVAGLFATSGGSVWVNQDSGVSLLSRTGRVLSSFEHQPDRSCGANAPASRYGGIAANGDTVYVANRCHGSMSVYSREGRLRATVDLPGAGYPRGIAYGVAQAGKPATVYVAMPDRGVVLAYRASSLRNSSKPMRTYTVKRPAGGKKPQPAGVAVDKWGQLTVADMANNAIFMVDANHDFSLYRTLGHPPRASRQAGRLNTPGAIAQHPQDGSGMAGDLFIADTNNNRVQRWNNSGYTYWAKKVNAGGGSNPGPDPGPGPDPDPDPGPDPDPDPGPDPDPSGEGPINRELPEITGTPAVGSVLSCSQGSWIASGGPAGGTVEYTWSWRRSGTTIASATSPTYTVVDADGGKALDCVVRAENNFGYTDATSVSVTVGGGGTGGDRPTNTRLPSITGSPTVGAVLICDQGGWTGTSPTFGYQWKRDTVMLAGATSPSYTVVPGDNGKALTCTVTASTAAGETSATSAPFPIGGGSTGGPTNTSPPVITGSFQPGGTLACSTGAWSSTPLETTIVWYRDSIVVGVGATYATQASDAGKSFTCTVTARIATGTTTATSAGVTIGAATNQPPANTAPPSISPTGTVAVGTALTCSSGNWTGATQPIAYAWRRGSTPIGGANAATYTPVSADAGSTISCTAIATNAFGSAAANSTTVTVADANPPANAGGAAAPTLSGSGAVGTALACAEGTWTGTGISYRFTWLRNGTPIPDTASSRYLVLTEDVGTSISCTVTARNSAGSSTASTAGLSLDGIVVGAPTPTAAPTITGTAAVGQTITCAPGDWTNTPTGFTTLWQRDGETIGNGSATYVVVAADQAATLRCVVIASNAAGKGAARSGPIGGAACQGTVGVTVNAGDTDTTSPNVQLAIRVPAGTTSIKISNTSDMSGAQTVTPTATCSYPWKMDSIPGLPLTWSVYVQFDGAGTIYSDSIRIDQPASLLRLW